MRLNFFGFHCCNVDEAYDVAKIVYFCTKIHPVPKYVYISKFYTLIQVMYNIRASSLEGPHGPAESIVN